jgi:xanthine dehydrogenase accessory factor
MMPAALRRRAEALSGERTPFATATVVRAAHPTSVQPGDVALVLGDGTIEGFVGGVCAEQSVRLHALRTLETGEALLLRILPGDGEAPASEGAVTVQNPCLSGGAIEIFLEPVLPAPRVLVVGTAPIAGALARLGPQLGLDVVEVSEGEPGAAAGDLALVVASHGRDELAALRSALEAGLPYVGLVASRRRGDAILGELRDAGVSEDRLARIDTPAGIEIGARTPEEIALSILARIVSVRRGGAGDGRSEDPATTEVATAVDPVCGMAVAITPDTPHVEHEGHLVHFCCEGCRATFEQDPARVAAR